MAGGSCSPVGGVALGGSAPLTFTSAAPTTQVPSNVRLLWDLDNDGDFDEAEEDVTTYALALETMAGRDYPSNLTGRAGPGKLRVSLLNEDDRFNLYNTSSPLTTDPFSLRSGRRMRLETTDGVRGASAITYVGIGAAAAGNNASLVPALPTGLISASSSPEGNADLMLILASIRNSGTGTVNTPTGWAPMPGLSFGNVTVLGRYYVDGDTAPTVTFAGGAANATTLAQCFAFRGCHQSLALVVAASATQLNASAQNMAVPGLVAAAIPGVLVDPDQVTSVIVGWKQDDWTSVAQLSGQFFTEISDTPSVLGDDAGHEIQYRLGGGVNFKTVSSTNLVVTGGANAISRTLVFQLCPAIDRTDPVLLARDRFDRAPSITLGLDELGNTWTTRAGSGFGVGAGSLATVLFAGAGATYNTSIAETVDTGMVDHYVQGAMVAQVQDGRVGLVARFVDTNNYVRAYYSATDRGLIVEDRTAGVTTQLGLFHVEAWDGMTLGLGVRDQEVTLYLGGAPLDFGAPLHLTRALTGTHAGMYGLLQTHSDRPPQVYDFYVWDRVRTDIDGVLWTGYVKVIPTPVKAGDLKVVTLEAEGPLAAAAVADVAAPRIVRLVDEHDEGVNHSVPAGAIVGDVMARAGLLHPPHPLDTTPLSHLGPHAVGDGKALEMARRPELAELGFLRETNEGAIAFEDRDWRTARSSRAWFTDTPGHGQYGYRAIDPFDQQTQIINRAVSQVAATAPTVVDVSNQFDDDSSLDVVITVPSVSEGQLVLVFVSCSSADTAGEWGAPPPWKSHRDLRNAEGNGMRLFSLIAEGTETAASVTFYKGATQGTFIAHIYVIDDWYGTEDGIKLGRVSTGTNAYPVSPGWDRAPALYILFQCVIGASTALVWGPLSTPPPIGYDYNSLEGLVTITAPPAYEVGVESVYKVDVLDTEQPGPWLNVFQDYLLLETAVVAVRGFNGPLEQPTLDNPRAAAGQGWFVQDDDRDSQYDHNVVRSNPETPVLLYTENDARQWNLTVIGQFGDDRPIIAIDFIPSRSAQLRTLATRLRVSDVITVTATGNAGLGIEGDFTIEHITHRFDNGVTLWTCRWELSPV